MDNLEKFLKDNIQNFDTDAPKDGHRDRMIMKMMAEKSRARLVYGSMAAAVAIVLVVLGSVVGLETKESITLAEDTEMTMWDDDDILPTYDLDNISPEEVAEMERIIDERLEEAKLRLFSVLARKPKDVRERVLADLSDAEIAKIDDPRTKYYVNSTIKAYKQKEQLINRLISQLR